MKGRYKPNKIPPAQLRLLAGSSLFLFAYGTWSVWRNDLAFPIYFCRRGCGSRSWLHLSGDAAWIAYGAILCACLVMISIMADHYDERDNERHYKIVAQVLTYAGWTLAAGSVVSWLSASA